MKSQRTLFIEAMTWRLEELYTQPQGGLITLAELEAFTKDGVLSPRRVVRDAMAGAAQDARLSHDTYEQLCVAMNIWPGLFTEGERGVPA